MGKKYLILPGCNDTNRGDQALIWETVRLGKSAGFLGKYYMLSSEQTSQQSQKEGIQGISLILSHPSEHIKEAIDNKEYGLYLKFRWITASLSDLVIALPLLSEVGRKLLFPFLDEKRKRTLHVYEKSDAAFIKGGGFLHTYEGGLLDTYKIFFFLYHINLALSMKIPVYVMPNSYGPFKGRLIKWMVQFTLTRCEKVTSREHISQKVLNRDIHIESKLCKDLAFYLQGDNYFDANQYLLERGIPLNTKKCVALTVRPYRFPGEKSKKNKYLLYKKSILYFVDWLNKNDFYPVFIEHVYDKNSHECDLVCIKEIEQMLPENINYNILSDMTLNCRQMKNIYSCFDYMIGTRFHSVIFSLISGVPSIAITYGGNKGVGVMNDIGLEKYIIPIEKISGEELVKKFKQLIENRGYIKRELLGICKRCNEYREKLIKYILEKSK